MDNTISDAVDSTSKVTFALAPDTPVVAPTPEPQISTTIPDVVVPVITPTPVSAIPTNTIENASILGKILYQNVVDYIAAMAPRKPVLVSDGVRSQVQLFRSLTNIINNLESDFNVVFGSVLQLFNEHSEGSFHETRVFRFFDNIPLSKEESTSFQRLLNLIKVTADPKSRSTALKQVNIAASLEFVSEKGKQKVMAFFNHN